MDIKIDYHENKRVKEATKYYESKNHTVETLKLPTGDFVFEDKVAFEYKTYSDLFNSITTGRVFDEAIRQSETYPYHFVIIVGSEKNRKNELYKLYKLHVKFTMKQYYGAIARLNTYTNVIYAPNTPKAFKIMECQADKCLDSKPIIRELENKTDNPCLNLLMFMSDIKEKRAELIVDSLDLTCYEDLRKISYNDLIDIKGIGKETATTIMDSLHKEWGIK